MSKMFVTKFHNDHVSNLLIGVIIGALKFINLTNDSLHSSCILNGPLPTFQSMCSIDLYVSWLWGNIATVG